MRCRTCSHQLAALVLPSDYLISPSGRIRPSPQPLKPSPHRTRQRCSGPAGGGFDGIERAGTRSDSRKQGQNSADGCGEDRAEVLLSARALTAPAFQRRVLVFSALILFRPS